jgi:hypothetical protein
MVCAVVNIFPHSAIGHHARAFQLRQMTGDARLTHAKNLLQLRNGKLFLLEKQQQTQAGGVCQQPQQING